MIHSLAGGELRTTETHDFAKVEILEGICAGDIFWYISNIKNLKVGDMVLVPLGKNNLPAKAKVLRIDKNVSSQTSPIPPKHAKEILQIL
jgi:hypothetical protein